VQAQGSGKSASAAERPAAKAKRTRAGSKGVSSIIEAAEEQPATSDPQSTVVGSGRQAAQGMEYKEKTSLSLPDSKVAVKKEQIADTELNALESTRTDAEAPRR